MIWTPPKNKIITNNLDWSLTPNQYEIYKCDHPNQIAFTGRRFGKTQVALTKLSTKAVTLPNQSLLFLALTQKHAQVIAEKRLEDMSHPYFLKKIDRSLPVVFTYANGSTITLGGTNNPERLQGMGYDYIVMDEAGDQDQQMYEQYILPTLADREGGCLMIGTTKGPENWVSERLDSPEYKTFRFTTLDGGIVQPEYLEMQRKIMDEATFKQEFLGEIVSRAGLVYLQFNKARNLTEQAFQEYCETYISFDFNVDPMSCVVIQRNINNPIGWCVVKEFVIQNSNTPEMLDTLEIYFAQNNFRGRLTATGDFAGGHRQTANASSNSDWKLIHERFKNYLGFDTRKRRTTSIRDRVNNTNQALKDGRLVLNNSCDKTWKELLSVEWKEGTGKINDRGGKVGHISDALSYFCMNVLDVIEPSLAVIY